MYQIPGVLRGALLFYTHRGVYNADSANESPFAHHLSRSELQTTETELKAMAMLAIQGWRVIPNGTNTPAARGMPIRL